MYLRTCTCPCSAYFPLLFGLAAELSFRPPFLPSNGRLEMGMEIAK